MSGGSGSTVDEPLVDEHAVCAGDVRHLPGWAA